MARELMSSLTLEEHAALDLYCAGVPLEEAAKQLNVSVRTLYRRLEQVRERFSP